MAYFEQWRGRLGIIFFAGLCCSGLSSVLAEDGVLISNQPVYMTDTERKAWQEGLTTQSIKKLPALKAPVADKSEKPVIKTARQEMEPGLETHSKETVLQSCKTGINEHLKSSPIEFLPGRTTLNAENMDVVKKLATLLNDCGRANVIVEGHSDSLGQDDVNQRLSGMRAASVMEALVRLGVKANRLRAVGYGSEKPLVENDTVENRALNRRIEVTLY